MLPVERLIQAAQEARSRAYAPYSGYSVGAALESDSGQMSVGCNVENLSYGATICAERSAIVGMVSNGLGIKVRQIAVVSLDGVTPCGICLQALSEFVPKPDDLLVHCVAEGGQLQSYTLADLLPHAFISLAVKRTVS
jgi:cytidine deaminase